MSRHGMGSVLVIGAVSLVAAMCSRGAAPTAPSSTASTPVVGSATVEGQGGHVHAMADEDKGYCAYPPSSSADSKCEIGAPAEVPPRSGNIPTIYAIAAAGFTPPAGTASCLAGTPCLNHPKMIDLSRIGGPPSAPPASHSHILNAHGGWFHTVNIRVFSPAAWNEIAQAKSLAKVRELQGNNPRAGTPGVISADTDTNIYFFIAGARPD